MLKSSRLFGFVLVALLIALPLAAQEGEAAADDQEDMTEVDEVIVVTASRTEQRLHEVPAAISVLDEKALAAIPADDYGDYLRNVPGLNVSQISARDIQITGRSATGSLSTSQLVLMDNRTLYLDFFGFVMWDFVPLDPKEIKQIEVVRGPGSAVWGANAMTGVINLITKRPREMQGTSVTLGGGDFGTLYGSVTHAGASEKLGYKISAAYYEQDPLNRPTGLIPGTSTPYPPFRNEGTEQPKFNLRFDYDSTPEVTWSFALGIAETDGIMHSGIGPFDITKGSAMNFAKVDWMRRAARATFFVNQLDGDASNLLSRGPTGLPLQFVFQSDTYNFDISNTSVVGANNIFTYGATARRNEFDLSIAPRGDKREEFGVFVQDEILIGDKVRWLIGARYDDIDPIGDVFSPRTSLIIAPNARHSFRLSFNRAFRAPSMINNFLDTTIVNRITIPPVPPLLPVPIPYVFPTRILGNPLLQEEQMDAFEVGYVGTIGGTTITVAAYENEETDAVDFFANTFYNSTTNPPPGWPLPLLIPFPVPFPPGFVLVGTVPADTLPSSFTYRNIGEITNRGVELAVDVRPGGNWSWFFNYSWQDEPETVGVDRVTLADGTVRNAINSPPENRINAGMAWDNGRYYFNANANYQDEAFWTDVLDARFWGPTDSFTQVNVGVGVRFNQDRTTLSVNAQNVFDEDVLQHVFGDLIERKIVGQLLVRF